MIVLRAKIIQEVANYLRCVKVQYCEITLGEHPTVTRAVDYNSIKMLQSRAPIMSKMDRKYISDQFEAKRLFPSLTDPALRRAVEQAINRQGPILTLHTLKKDVNVLKQRIYAPLSRIIGTMKREKKGHTLRAKVKAHFEGIFLELTRTAPLAPRYGIGESKRFADRCYELLFWQLMRTGSGVSISHVTLHNLASQEYQTTSTDQPPEFPFAAEEFHDLSVDRRHGVRLFEKSVAARGLYADQNCQTTAEGTPVSASFMAHYISSVFLLSQPVAESCRQGPEASMVPCSRSDTDVARCVDSFDDELVSDRPSWTTSEASSVTTTSSRSVSETHTPNISPSCVHTVPGGQAVLLQSQSRKSMAASIDQHVSSRRSSVSAASSRHLGRNERHEPNSVIRTSTDSPMRIVKPAGQRRLLFDRRQVAERCTPLFAQRHNTTAVQCSHSTAIYDAVIPVNFQSDGGFYTDMVTPSDAMLEDVQSSSASGGPYYRPEESDVMDDTPTQDTWSEKSAPEHAKLTAYHGVSPSEYSLINSSGASEATPTQQRWNPRELALEYCQDISSPRDVFSSSSALQSGVGSHEPGTHCEQAIPEVRRDLRIVVDQPLPSLKLPVFPPVGMEPVMFKSTKRDGVFYLVPRSGKSLELFLHNQMLLDRTTAFSYEINGNQNSYSSEVIDILILHLVRDITSLGVVLVDSDRLATTETLNDKVAQEAQ